MATQTQHIESGMQTHFYVGRMGDEINRLGATPVYQQVAQIIRARINSGKIKPNRPIPSEAHLEQEFGVARETARKAVARLREEGLIVTVRGRGSFAIGDTQSG